MHKFGCYKPGGRPLSPTTMRELKAKNPDAICEVKSKSGDDVLYYRRPGIADKIELGEKKEKAEKQEKTLLEKAKAGPALDRVRAKITGYVGKLQANEKAYKMAMMLLYPSVPDIKRDIVQKQMVEIERNPTDAGLVAVLQETGIAPDLLTEMKQESPAQPQPAITDHPQEPPVQPEQEAQEEKEEKSEPKVLKPFQAIGAQFLDGKNRALLADEMGLGKTVQAAVALSKSNEPTLIICPATLKLNWEKELKDWAPNLKPAVLFGKNSFRMPGNGEAVIVNYDILPKEMKDLPAGLRVVIDEAHYLKDKKTQRSQKVRQVAEKAGRVWALTGTPLKNNPPDLFGVLEQCDLVKDSFGHFGRFYYMFRGKKLKYGTDWGDPRPEVPGILGKIMLRRLRKEVLPELPEKTYREIEVNIESASLLKKLDKAAEKIDYNNPNLPPFEAFSEIRQALAEERIPHMREIVQQHEEAKMPLVVFSSHRGPIDDLSARDGWAVITGDTPAAKRQEIVENFQAGKLKGVGATIQAGGVGITLTRAANVLFTDLDWTPANNSQAEDRVVRIGQQAKGVQIMRMVSNHALDKHIAKLLIKKMRLARETLGDKIGAVGAKPQAAPQAAVAKAS